MKRPAQWVAGAALVCVASLARAQTPEAPAAAPTPSRLTLSITEPPDGAILPGSSVRIVFDEIPPAGASNPMPEPQILVFLDDTQKAALSATRGSLTVDGVPAGRHRLTILAVGPWNDVLDRRDISITTAALEARNPATAPPAGPRPDSPWAPEPGLPWERLVVPLLTGLALVTIATALAARRRFHR